MSNIVTCKNIHDGREKVINVLDLYEEKPLKEEKITESTTICQQLQIISFLITKEIANTI